MITAIGDVLRRCYERGWITSRDGNCSLRRARSVYLYITPSGWRKTIVHPEHMIKIKFVDGQMQVPAGTNPSGELHMHYLLTRGVNRTRAVVHVQATISVPSTGRSTPARKRSSPASTRRGASWRSACSSTSAPRWRAARAPSCARRSSWRPPSPIWR